MVRALDTRARKLGGDHLHTALARRDLAVVKLDLRDPVGAHQLLTRARATLTRLRPADDPDRAEVESLLGVAERQQAEK